MEKVDHVRRWRQRWGSLAWWIVVCYSVPFSLYTLCFVYGEFEIYKHLTVYAFVGNYDLAGLHIAKNLRLWQIHATAALLYVMIGPLQFSPSFRSKYPDVHRRLGYMFALCSTITSVTGATTMRRESELGPLAKSLFPFMSVGCLTALAISINAARSKHFQTHRRWMLRSAAIGYSVMYTRLLPEFIKPILRVTYPEAVEYSFPVSIALSSGLAEIYIITYLTEPDREPEPGTLTGSARVKKLS